MDYITTLRSCTTLYIAFIVYINYLTVCLNCTSMYVNNKLYNDT